MLESSGFYSNLREFGHVKINESLSKHTTFKIGGPADFFVVVSETDKLVTLLQFLSGEGVPFFIIGGGSNMLVSDEGYRGVVIKMQNSKIKIKNSILVADAGCATVQLAQESIKANLTGFEWGVGVPGTIGGAVRGNAGAMGAEMKDVVVRVETFCDVEIKEFSVEECRFAYRESVFKHNGAIILRVWLSLAPTDSRELMKQALGHIQYRNKTQPQGWASTGCIFKNVKIKHKNEKLPLEFIEKGLVSAGWLIDQSGMKGAQVGQAKVSERHGNFIVNLGGASAQDVQILIAQIKQKVYDKFGIMLEEEIQFI